MAKSDDDLPWEQMHPWFKQAHDIGVLNGGFVAVQRETPEFKSWLKYFRDDVGFTPQFMRDAANGLTGAVTLPSKWPPIGALRNGPS
jgi:hypothetical protein